MSNELSSEDCPLKKLFLDPQGYNFIPFENYWTDKKETMDNAVLKAIAYDILKEMEDWITEKTEGPFRICIDFTKATTPLPEFAKWQNHKPEGVFWTDDAIIEFVGRMRWFGEENISGFEQFVVFLYPEPGNYNQQKLQHLNGFIGYLNGLPHASKSERHEKSKKLPHRNA